MGSMLNTNTDNTGKTDKEIYKDVKAYIEK